MLLNFALLPTLAAASASCVSSAAGWPAVHALPDKAGWSWSAGNHRYSILVTELPAASGGLVHATIPWRRRDGAPLSISAFVVDARSHLRVPHCTLLESSSSHNGTFIFSAANGPGEYHLYYLPFETCEFKGGACGYNAGATYEPTGKDSCAVGGPSWWDPVPVEQMARPSQTLYQARTYFDAFTENERPAAPHEATEFIARASAAQGSPAALLISEDRQQPLIMTEAIPYQWTLRNASSLASFFGVAQPGEKYTLQLGLFAHTAAVSVVAVTFTDMQMSASASPVASASSSTIPAAALHCMNVNGTDAFGQPFLYPSAPSFEQGRVLPLWVSLRVPPNASAGTYHGSARIALGGDAAPLTAWLSVTVGGPALDDGGDSQAWRGTRLTWLDSSLAQGGEALPPPFTPIVVNETKTRLATTSTATSTATITAPKHALSVTMLDKRFAIDELGMVAEATVGTAAGSATGRAANAVQASALAAPGVGLRLNGETLQPVSFARGSKSAKEVTWRASASTRDADVQVEGSLDCTGYADHVVTIVSRTAGKMDARLSFAPPVQLPGALMTMGLGMKGGYINELPPAGPPRGAFVAWIELDFMEAVEASAMGLWAAGDSVHDPRMVEVHTSAAASGPWAPIRSWEAQSGTSDRQSFAFGDQRTVTSRYWRVVITSVAPSTLCGSQPFCQPWIAELQLRSASTGEWLVNSYGSSVSVLNASGSQAGMDAKQAVDGVTVFDEAAKKGWDCAFAPLPGSGPPPPPDPTVAKDWAWDGVNGNNGVWVGTSASGVRLFLKGEEPEWQAAVPFDSTATPSIAELSWHNGGKGGITLHKNGTIVAYTGATSLGAGQRLQLRFSVLITPVRPLDLGKHFGERYAHTGGPADYEYIASRKASVVVMHQGNAINPWINYPYETNQLMKEAADSCHALGLKYKIYNTMRELSNRCREIHAMRALNETYVLPSDPHARVSAGSDWLQEHLQGGFVRAWSNPVQNVYPTGSGASGPWQRLFVDHPPSELDAAIKTRAISRWNNYYVEGLRQMQSDFDFEGIYLDEIAYDRVTMQRAKAVLGEGGLIDHHSDRGGFTPSPATNYLEHYPFIDSLWYGEGFDYEHSSASYWLLEISGLPHGLTADLLRYDGMTPAHFKGMVFGSANRWQGPFFDGEGGADDNPFSPLAIWELWDSFGIGESVMHGWWMERERGNGTIPVLARPESAMVKVTSFVRKGKAALLCLASFNSTADANITLDIDWAALGLPPGSQLLAPALKPMQPVERHFEPTATISIAAGQGMLLLVGTP